MDQELMRSAEKYGKRQRKRKLWEKVVSVLGCIVVFCTTYALILPAITMTHPTYCGLEEHQHDESCYEMTLVCGEEEREPTACVHHHTSSCYVEERTLTCSQEEGESEEDGEEMSHTHSDDCYTVTQVLTCGLEEGEELEDSWEPGHTHTDECYELTLTCQLPEHTHGPECYLDPDSETDSETGDEEEIIPDASIDVPMAEEPDDIPDPDIDLDDIQAFAQLVPVQTNGIRRAAARAGTTDDSNDPNNFERWITTVEASHRAHGADKWEPLKEGDRVKEDDELLFKINYQIPTGTLSEDNRTVHYDLPLNLQISQETTGKVYDSLGKEVGTYVIGTNGRITIEFSESYAKSNKTQAIVGYISVESAVSSILDSESGGKNLNFKDNLTIGIEVVDEEKDRETLSVKKEATSINKETGEVSYTITVTSTSGTSNAVQLHDVMTNIQLENGKIKVTDKAGEEVTPTEPTTTNGSFDMTLPKMEENGVYTITYTGILPGGGPVKADVTAKNKVTVETERDDHVKIEDSSEVDTEFKQDHVSKTGKLEGDKIVWTITVNQGKHNIKDWTLSDTLNGKEFKGPVKITDSNGKVIAESATLPYTFLGDSTDTYTITYEMPVNSGTQENVQNTAELTRPGSEEPDFSDGTSVKVEINPLKKEAVDWVGDPDISDPNNKTATIKWKVTIDATKGEIPAPWTYTDELWDKQWFTAEQQAAIVEAVKKALTDVGMNPDQHQVSFITKTLDGEEKVIGFSIGPTAGGKGEALPKGKIITFTYESTAPLGDGNKELNFRNSAHIGNHFANGEITYKPSNLQLTKKDENEGNGEDTKHNYYNLKRGEGVLSWLLTIKVPEGYEGGDLTLTEHLPDGVDLQYLEILADGVFGAEKITTIGSHTIKGNNDTDYTITVNQSGQTVTVGIPEDLATNPNLKEIRIVVRVKIRDDFNWPTDDNGKLIQVDFTNTAEIKSADDKYFASDSQTQEIEKDYSKVAIRKGIAGSNQNGSFENNQIPYSIVINEKGEMLLDGKTPFYLIDELTYHDNPTADNWTPINIFLVPNSVHVYEYDTTQEGNRGEERTDISYVYEEIITPGDGGVRKRTCSLKVELPDGIPLLVEYKYKVSAEVGYEDWHLTNTARLEGENFKSEDAKTETHIKIVDSHAEANLQGVTVYKVDSADSGHGLNQAEYELYKYQAVETDSEGKPTEYDYVLVRDDPYVTGNVNGTDGVLVLDHLDYNTAYKLVEVKAPNGYVLDSKPYYFYIYNEDTENNPEMKPDGFDGTAHMQGDIIRRPNTPNRTSIRVDKKWFHTDGTDITLTKIDGEIRVQLYRVSSATPPSGGGESESDTATVSICITARGDWWEETLDVKIGSTVTLTIWDRWALSNHSNWFNVKNNGVLIDSPTPTPDEDGSAGTYSFSFVVQGDTVIDGYVNSAAGDLTHSVSTQASNPTTSEQSNSDSSTPVGAPCGDPVTLTAGDHWTHTFNNLPRYEVDDDGKITAYYTYYVKEVRVPGFDTEYENNDGIVSGTITLKNTRQENPSLVLPETGGHGTLWYTLGGAGLMAGALMYSLLWRRKVGDGCK